MAISRNLSVITDAGAAVIAECVYNSKKVVFTEMRIGSGAYEESEITQANLRAKTQLKSEKNTYKISRVELDNAGDGYEKIRVSAGFSNYDNVNQTGIVSTGYFITEVGVYGKVQGEDTNVLLAICVIGDPNHIELNDYMPAYDSQFAPVHIMQDVFMAFPGAGDSIIGVGGAFYLAVDGEELENRMDSVESRATALETDKVDRTTPTYYLDTNAALSSIDGALYAAITALGWASDVII